MSSIESLVGKIIERRLSEFAITGKEAADIISVAAPLVAKLFQALIKLAKTTLYQNEQFPSDMHCLAKLFLVKVNDTDTDELIEDKVFKQILSLISNVGESEGVATGVDAGPATTANTDGPAKPKASQEERDQYIKYVLALDSGWNKTVEAFESNHTEFQEAFGTISASAPASAIAPSALGKWEQLAKVVIDAFIVGSGLPRDAGDKIKKYFLDEKDAALKRIPLALSLTSVGIGVGFNLSSLASSGSLGTEVHNNIERAYRLDESRDVILEHSFSGIKQSALFAYQSKKALGKFGENAKIPMTINEAIKFTDFNKDYLYTAFYNSMIGSGGSKFLKVLYQKIPYAGNFFRPIIGNSKYRPDIFDMTSRQSFEIKPIQSCVGGVGQEFFYRVSFNIYLYALQTLLTKDKPERVDWMKAGTVIPAHMRAAASGGAILPNILLLTPFVSRNSLKAILPIHIPELAGLIVYLPIDVEFLRRLMQTIARLINEAFKAARLLLQKHKIDILEAIEKILWGIAIVCLVVFIVALVLVAWPAVAAVAAGAAGATEAGGVAGILGGALKAAASHLEEIQKIIEDLQKLLSRPLFCFAVAGTVFVLSSETMTANSQPARESSDSVDDQQISLTLGFVHFQSLTVAQAKAMLQVAPKIANIYFETLAAEFA